MRWQDNEAIHQDVLEREIILQDDLQPDIIAAAQQRWSDLANQSSEKQGGMSPPGGPPLGGPGVGMGPSINAPPPTSQPLAPGNPSVGSAPPLGGPMVPGLGGQGASQQDEQARAFEALAPK